MIKIDGFSGTSNYYNVTSDDCPSFSGIVAGECKGDLWVDSINNPKIAIANSYAVGSFAFLGSINNDNEYENLENFIRQVIFSFLKENDSENFEFSIEHDCLKPYILKMFNDKTINHEEEYSFRRTEGINQIYSLPEDYRMQKIDYDFWKRLMDGVYKNEALLTERLLESWGSFEIFEKKSVAFCITYSESIAAVIVGTARFKNIIPIDIETDKKFRHKGLGYALTVEFVNECMKKGLVAQWDCVESNPFSRKLAEKAGFKPFKENDVYWFAI
ncbi:MAG: acetyltransferase [Eubacterium sp.]|nr:acetyltransferase [Eubacterium sp.]